MSHREMGGTRKAWVNVSDRDQMSTMARPVSRYKNKIQPNSNPSAPKACRQAGEMGWAGRTCALAIR